MKSPIFIFSLPRSGSTFLQRLLMGHREIASVAEPWIMLPLVYASRVDGIVSRYNQFSCSQALTDFIANLPEQSAGYQAALRLCVANLYEQQCQNNETYFLDKTPRYYKIIPEIHAIFPDAKFIFLFRNPVHVMSSVIQTWGDNRLFNLHRFHMDLYDGPSALSQAYLELKDCSCAVQYEDLIANPELYVKRLCDYLELDFDESMLENFFLQDTKGCLGDPVGTYQYRSVERAPLDKWRSTFGTRFRKKLLNGYVEDLDDSVLATQGYSKAKILHEIQSLEVSNDLFWTDWYHKLYSDALLKAKHIFWKSRFGEKLIRGVLT